MKWRFYLNPLTDNLLVKEPIGWKDISLNLKRDMDAHGIFYEQTHEVEFTGRAYTFIKQQYEDYGQEADISLLAQLKCDEEGTFEDVYSGKLNLTQVRFECERGCKVKVNVEPEGCLMTFDNRKDQKVDLSALFSFDQSTALTPYDNIDKEITISSKTIVKKYEADATTDDYATAQSTGDPADGVPLLLYGYVGLMPSGVTVGDVTDVNATGVFADATGMSVPLFTLTESGSGAFDASLGLNVGFSVASTGAVTGFLQGTTINVYYKLKRGGSFIVTDLVATVTDTYPGAGLSIDSGITLFDCDDYLLATLFVGFTYSTTYDYEVGDEIYFYAECVADVDGISGSDPGELYDYCIKLALSVGDGNYLHFSYDSEFPATPAKVTLINEALSRSVEAITDDCMRVYSEYFGRTDAQPYTSGDGDGALEAITSGLHIRQFADAKLKVSFKDLMEGLVPIHNIGYGIEEDPNRSGYNLVRVEPVEYFYNSTVILECDKIRKAVRNATNTGVYSKLKFGYQKWEAEQYTGLDEFNTSREYRTTLNKVAKTLEQLSSMIGSGYALEITRRLPFVTNSTKDWRYDNDTFIICVVRDSGTFIPEQGNIDNAANLIDPPTVLNFRISPARNAMRWMKWVLQSYKNPYGTSSKLIFTNGTGNYIAEGELNSGYILENSVINESEELGINDFDVIADGLPFLVPQTYEFTYPMSLRQWKAVKANPYGTIRIRYGQETDFINTYIQHIQYKPNQGKAEFTLIPRYPTKSDEQFNNLELRPDGGIELRPDGGYEVRN